MSTDRRSFLTHLGAGVTVAGTALASGVSVANAQSSSTFTPARHAQDDWMDKLPGRHRMVFDTTSPAGFGAALAYANNFLNASKEYGLTDQDHAVIIIARHFGTTFAYNDAMWAKYGKAMPPMVALDDPKTKTRAAINLYAATGYQDLPNMGTTIPDVLQKGVHFAVCNLATTFFAGMLAQATGGKQDAVYKELTANLIGNSHLVPAGIVAVNRAQEHGFTLTTAVWSRTMRTSLIALALAITATVAGAQAPVTKASVPGVVNFSKVETTVACAGATTPAALAGIKSMGYNSVINLRTPGEAGAELEAEAAAAKAAGITYVHLPFNAQAPDPALVDNFLKAITDKANQPAFIHCASANRAAALWMVKRIAVDKWDVERATAEATALGLTSPALKTFAIEQAQKH